MAFTYIRKSLIEGTDVKSGVERTLYKKFCTGTHPLWRFGFDPDTVPAFLREYGWNQLEQVGPDEYSKRYIAPTGRGLPIMGAERTVYAEKS